MAIFNRQAKQHLLFKYLIMKPAIIITFTFILISSMPFAQGYFKPVYIITNEKDTLFGTGSIAPNQDFCFFKVNEEGDYRIFKADEITAFRIIDGQYFVSKQIKNPGGDNKCFLLEFLVDGEIDVFRLRNANRFFIEKENEELLELKEGNDEVISIDGRYYTQKDRTYAGYMRYYMSDAPVVFPEIDKIDRLTQRDLVKIAVDYHNAVCTDEECINYTKALSEMSFTCKLEAFSGVNYHNAYYTPYYGLQVHVWRKMKKERFFLKMGIIYSDKNYENKLSNDADARDYSIKIPISLQYVFCDGIFKPTIAIGWPTGFLNTQSIQAGFILSLSKNFELNLNGSIDGLYPLFSQKNQEYFNNNLAHTLSFGIMYRLN
jgi:hypothetical protein